MTSYSQVRRALLVVALVALLVLAGCAGGGSDSAATSTGAPPAGGAVENGDAERGKQSHYSKQQRVIVRTASMELRVKQFDERFRKARAVARKHGGFVTDYDINSRGNWKRGTFTVRVPAGNFSEARDGLAGLGKLEDERVQAHDFTNEHRERRGQLAQLRQRERNLEAELNNTSDEDERDDIRARLHDVRDRIAELEARQAALERRESLSTIRVTMHEPVEQKPPKNYRSSFGFGDSLLAGFYGGLTVLKGAIVLTGYLVSLALAALVLGVLGMGFYAGGLSLTQRLWPRMRDVFGIERSTPSNVEPQTGSGAPPPNPDDEFGEGGGES